MGSKNLKTIFLAVLLIQSHGVIKFSVSGITGIIIPSIELHEDETCYRLYQAIAEKTGRNIADLSLFDGTQILDPSKETKVEDIAKGRTEGHLTLVIQNQLQKVKDFIASKFSGYKFLIFMDDEHGLSIAICKDQDFLDEFEEVQTLTDDQQKLTAQAIKILKDFDQSQFKDRQYNDYANESVQDGFKIIFSKYKNPRNVTEICAFTWNISDGKNQLTIHLNTDDE